MHPRQLIFVEFPQPIIKRMSERLESERLCLLARGITPPEPRWDELYSDWRKFAELYPHRFRNIVRGNIDTPSLSEIQSDINNECGRLRSVLAKRQLSELKVESIKKFIVRAFDYICSPVPEFFLTPHPRQAAFCDDAWHYIERQQLSNSNLFRAAIMTNRSKEMIMQYATKLPRELSQKKHAKLLEDAVCFCMGFQHNNELTWLLIDRVIELKILSPKILMMYACEESDLSAISYLMGKAKTKLNEPVKSNDFNITPLFSALMGDGINGTDIQVIEYLLSQGADVMAHCTYTHQYDQNVDKLTPVYQAKYNGNKAIVMLLLRQHVNRGLTLQRNQDGFNILHAVCAGPNVNAYRILTKQWYDSNNPYDGYAEYISFLLENGLSATEVTTNEGFSPLYLAASNHGVRSISLLLEAGAEINATARNGQTALFRAYDPEVMALLLENGANIHHQDNMGHTALISLSQYFKFSDDDPSCIGTLISKSFSMMPQRLENEEYDRWLAYWKSLAEYHDYFQFYYLSHNLFLLTLIATRQPLSHIKAIIKQGAEVDTVIAHPHTAISMARLIGTEEVIQYLEDVQSQNNSNHSLFALFAASPDNSEEPDIKRLKRG